MILTKTIKSYAKINLYLNVGAKRPDGYHDLESVMQQVTLFDYVTVLRDTDTTQRGVRITCTDRLVPSDDRNIAAKCARMFLDKYNINSEVSVSIDKRIPVAAGLGGGSSDAAAVLAVLEDKYKALGRERLLSLSEKLGADVPFFLVGGTALCSHYGEKIKKINDCPECYILIAKWGKKPSTAEMYKRLDEAGNFSGGSLEKLIAAINIKDLKAVSSAVYNSFERGNTQKEVTELIEIMKEEGALSSHLSGSGPSVFGIFMDKEKAENCEKLLKQKNIFASLTKTVY